TLISERLADMPRVLLKIVCRDLHRPLHALTYIGNELAASPTITLANTMRENQFGISVNASPQPKIAALLIALFPNILRLFHSARVTPYILPLLIKLNS